MAGAFLEYGNPRLPEAIETCIAGKARDIVIVPAMVFPNRHAQDQIPRFVEEAKVAHPAVAFHYARPIRVRERQRLIRTRE